MKRLLAVELLAGAVLAAGSTPASASAVCRNRILNQWEATGKISTTYPIACYRQALAYAKHIPDLEVYSSLPTDIRAAMADALARRHGKKAAAVVVSKNFPTRSNQRLATRRRAKKPGVGVVTTATPTSTGPLATGTSATGGGGPGLPVPLLVLGGLALLLAAAGAAGLIVKRRRGGPGRPA
ncbi:MAG TPA: hypothetical protein VFA05_02795 [Gaiellaceae bacterium]|nr:hypothetical protein [Gaiellaceae bacterium]